MRLKIAAFLILGAAVAFGQADRGTITGTITDPAGAVVPNAAVEATNQATGVKFDAGSSTTGNYTLAQIPVGTYELTVTVTGFKKFLRPGIIVPVAETVRVDATLEVGQTTETITVNEEAPLLKTESGEVSHQVDYGDADQLPLFTTNGTGGATGTGNIRDPLTILNLLPGANQSTDNTLRVNGLPSSSQTIMVEGMDATNGLWREINQSTQQGTDAIQEVSVQTSNYAAEYGGAGGGYLNFTMKSGTNQLHGSAYDYFVNEFLDAGLPDSANCNVNPSGNDCATNTNSGHVKNTVRRNDYGFTLGGPVVIPHVYNGKDKTFFFFNFEQFRQTTVTRNTQETFPTSEPGVACTATGGGYEQGCFGAALFPFPTVSGSLTNEIYDPASRVVSSTGVITETPFPNNAIPISRMDPVALYLQSLFPAPNIPGVLINNYNVAPYSNFQHTTIPSIKIDQSLSSTMKLSGYFSLTETNNPENNGLNLIDPSVFTVVPDADRSYTYRINFDDTITPTLLFHFGVGLLYYNHPEPGTAGNFTTGAEAAAANGYGGAPGGRTYVPFPASQYMPSISGLDAIFNGGASPGGFFGPNLGSSGLGSAVALKDIKPTGNTSMTWVHGNHTFKAGYDLVLEGFPQQSSLRAFGEVAFSNAQTENPAEYNAPGLNTAFESGFPYASYLLGLTNSVESSPINDTRLGNHSMGAYVQDSWKVNRKLTLELGLRWDYATTLSEQYGRMSDACFTCVNTSLASAYNPGGLAGGETYGATNNGPLDNTYPFSFGPHIGVAYQLDSKTVFRAGGSIAYSSSADNAYLSVSVADFYTLNSPGQFLPASQFSNGDPLSNIDRVFPVYQQYPFSAGPGTCGLNSNLPCIPPAEPFITIAKNAGRLPRIFQWSIGLQREVMPNLLVEAAYVGNRGAWFTAPLMDQQSFNGLTPSYLAGLATEGPGGAGVYGATSGINIQNPAQFALLSEPISNPNVTAMFPLLKNPSNVYPGFPSSEPLYQALRPYPQWLGVPNFLGPPDGDTWYDSLQVKVTKRYSHGLSAQGAYTWSKNLTNAANSNTSYFTPGGIQMSDPFNTANIKQLSALDQPQVMVISFSYTTPKINNFLGDNPGGKAVRWLARDWTVSGVLKYASGALIATPQSTNNLWTNLGYDSTGPLNFTGPETLENYVSGQSCLALNPNSHFNPTSTVALNAAAWYNQPTEMFGDSAGYYSDCRWQRQPAESLSLGRIFRVKEKYQLLIQAQFFNVFNRVVLPMPATGATASTTAVTSENTLAGYPACGTPGVPCAISGGFGAVAVNGSTGIGNPRSGQLVARFTF